MAIPAGLSATSQRGDDGEHRQRHVWAGHGRARRVCHLDLYRRAGDGGVARAGAAPVDADLASPERLLDGGAADPERVGEGAVEPPLRALGQSHGALHLALRAATASRRRGRAAGCMGIKPRKSCFSV